jgi:hypothetical protein
MLQILNGHVTVSRNCVITGKPYAVTVSKKEWEKYEAGELAQDAFPDLPAADREFIISGVSPEGWKSVFGDGDVEE